ncbi:acyl-homoserine-lactone synthase [Mesorhizobium sangaii]|uniref:Uncharacterized protein n=1 Tax=Mesorhizobium sangaii TaxID=505389 RepID=A0A841PN92_9HYPH|nr:hypothetical protein [Mesorhizobium sangaii]
MSLTLRGLMCPRQWAVRGKSAWEIGCILGSSGAQPRSISILPAEKLGVSPTKQAIARLAGSVFFDSLISRLHLCNCTGCHSVKVRLQWRGNFPEEAFDDPAYCARRYDNCANKRRAIHRPRYRVFEERLERVAEVDSGYEIDSFDPLTPRWLLLRGFDGLVAGCVRLLFSTVPMAHGSTKRRL